MSVPSEVSYLADVGLARVPGARCNLLLGGRRGVAVRVVLIQAMV
jgi:hypothetical protein